MIKSFKEFLEEKFEMMAAGTPIYKNPNRSDLVDAIKTAKLNNVMPLERGQMRVFIDNSGKGDVYGYVSSITGHDTMKDRLERLGDIVLKNPITGYIEKTNVFRVSESNAWLTTSPVFKSKDIKKLQQINKNILNNSIIKRFGVKEDTIEYDNKIADHYKTKNFEKLQLTRWRLK